MKAFLMFRDQDLDLKNKLPWNEQALIQDLELNTLFNAMAQGDAFLFDVSKRVVLSSLNDVDTLIYRQNILKDCLKNASIVRAIYQITIDSIENKKRHWMGIFNRYPAGILYNSRDMMQMFVELLVKLKNLADKHSDRFESEGFARFFKMIKKELDEEYISVVKNHIKELKFDSGVLISAELGKGNEGTNYILRRPWATRRGWLDLIFGQREAVYSFRIADRDESGARALAELKDRGVNLVANALAQSADHIDSFFTMLRMEMAFYVGCLNLAEQLAELEAPICFPVPMAASKRRHSFRGLYDVCLALAMSHKVVGNDVDADGKALVIVTGANQGGKSTFLRSIGLSQLMMQSGMFAPATSFSANICESLFTHYKREEDPTMTSGKLDEELARMSEIVDKMTPNSLVLFNESFAATNAREGSEIARQIVSALLERDIKVIFVTHLHEFAHSSYEKKMVNAIFLKAQRRSDGTRTFRLIEGEPQQTSYGGDLYKQIFATMN